jgi:DNA-binding MarR family transcriptional regulator
MPTHAEPESIDRLLAHVCHLHHERARMRFSGIGLHRGQPPLLFALWEQDGLTHTELAERLGVSAATISRMVQRMERAGFVQREPDATDQRVSRVYLAEAGRTIQTRVQKLFGELEAETLARLSPEECVLLRRLLEHIRANLLGAIDGAQPE